MQAPQRRQRGLIVVPGDDEAADTRFDLIPPRALRRLAVVAAGVALRWGGLRSERSTPASQFVNHALRHVNLWLVGDTAEDHLAHAAWNLAQVMHLEGTRPDLVDVATRPDSPTAGAV